MLITFHIFNIPYIHVFVNEILKIKFRCVQKKRLVFIDYDKFTPPEQVNCLQDKRESIREDALSFGAGKGSRTLLSSLGSLRSTDELYLRMIFSVELL